MEDCLTIEHIKKMANIPHRPMKPYYILTPKQYDYWKEQWQLTDEQMEQRGFVRDTYIPMP